MCERNNYTVRGLRLSQSSVIFNNKRKQTNSDGRQWKERPPQFTDHIPQSVVIRHATDKGRGKRILRLVGRRFIHTVQEELQRRKADYSIHGLIIF